MNGNQPHNNDAEPAAAGSKWLNSNVIGMGLASFLSDAGHEMATAILPLFLIAIGAPAVALGTIEGVADAASSLVKLGSGWLSDRIGKRKVIAVTGYALTGVTTGLFGLATSWPQVLLARAAGWLGRGIRGPVRDAMLSDSVPAEARGRAFGFHRAGDTLGAIAGPLLGLALLTLLGHGRDGVAAYRVVFWLTAIPGLLATLAFALLVKERAQPANRGYSFKQAVAALPTNFRLFLVGVGVFGLGDFAHSLLTLRAAQMLTPSLGAARASASAIGLYALHNVFYAAMSYPIGAVADRLGKRGLLALGYATAALMGVGWLLAWPSVWYLALLFALGGTFIAAEDTLEGSLAADLLPLASRGTGYGVLATVNGLGDFLSSIIVGALWTAVSVSAGFIYATVLFTLGAIVIFRVRGQPQPSQAE